MVTPASPSPAPTLEERARAIGRALKRHLSRLQRTLEAVRGDLDGARRAPELRRFGETLLVHLREVPKAAERVSLADVMAPERRLEIALDPRLSPQANAARYFKQAAKAERGLLEIPARVEALEAEIERVRALRERLDAMARDAADAEVGADDGALPAPSADATAVLAEAIAVLPPLLRREVESLAVPPGRAGRAPKKRAPPLPARLTPRRLRTHEGWDVLIGRSNEGNDHLTHVMARPEDYWFHVHGAPGSHVVLRRGKGKNEPSKVTLHEVAAWAAFYSQARNAGKVPVIYTRKKYVRKPRKSPPGLAMCEREQMLMVRPVEPPREALADEADGG